MSQRKPLPKWIAQLRKWRDTAWPPPKSTAAGIYISVTENGEVSILVTGPRAQIIHALTEAFCSDSQFSHDTAIASAKALQAMEAHTAVEQLIKEVLPNK